jgi:hypothetical protein
METNCYIDLLVVIPSQKLAFVIENKFHAIESHGQLEDYLTYARSHVEELRASALRTDQKAKNAFSHSVLVASVLNGPITTFCTAAPTNRRFLFHLRQTAIPNEPKTFISLKAI